MSAALTRPNIILILTDDQGYGDVGRHGNPVLETPHMDRLFDESVRFGDFCVSPSCSPSRCALMTGMHEFWSGVTHTIQGRNTMSLEATTLADVLRGAGYATGIFGKWHLGHQGAFRPEKRGFDYSLTTVEDTQRSHFDPVLLRNGVEESHSGFRTDILFREAIRFIEANQDNPFFCYIPTYSPHKPLVAPEEFMARYKGRVSDDEAAFFAMLANIDENIGRLMGRVGELGLDDNTLIILMNDNGATCGVDLWNANMRGCKGECRVFRKAMTGATAVAYSANKAQFHYAVTDGAWRLFDTRKDPGQETDLAAVHPEIAQTMAAGYDAWWDEVLPILA